MSGYESFYIWLTLSLCYHFVTLWAGALVQWLKLPAWKVGDRGLEPRSDIQVPKKTIFLPCSLVKIHYYGEPPWPRSSELGPDRQGSNFESWVWRAVSSRSSHHLQAVLLAQFSLYVHRGGLKSHWFHFILLLRLFVITLSWYCLNVLKYLADAKTYCGFATGMLNKLIKCDNT